MSNAGEEGDLREREKQKTKGREKEGDREI